jgi:hypothetical protein
MSVVTTWKRWLVVAATLSVCGCATDYTGGMPRKEGCPMSFTLSCEVSRPGAMATAERCRCVRHQDLNVLLHGR